MQAYKVQTHAPEITHLQLTLISRLENNLRNGSYWILEHNFPFPASQFISSLYLVVLLPNSPPLSYLLVLYGHPVPAGGCKVGEEEILIVTLKENPLQLQANHSLWECVCTIWHRTALKNKPDRAGFAQTIFHVVSCCYFTLLRYSSRKSSAYASITQIYILLCLFFLLGSVVLGRSFRVRN